MPLNEPPARIVIIGAGPAGLLAADRLSELGYRVLVCEKMPSPARKFLLAGRGGLNLTHSEALSNFLTRYREAERALTPAIEAFDSAALRAWCEELGQETFVGTSGRVFPKALKASPLLRALLRRLGERGVELRTGHDWRGVGAAGELLFETPRGPATIAGCDAVLFALGGGSWPRLGSDAAWTGTFARLGIETKPFRPSNCGFTVDWSASFADRFAGTPLKRVELAAAGRKARGEAMITASGIEGGAVYALSATLRDTIEEKGKVELAIDLRPDLDEATLAARLEKPRGKQSMSTYLRKAAGLSPVAIALLREQGRLPDDAVGLARRIKASTIILTATQPLERAISSAGGIPFAEVDENFMLKSHPGFFVAGEMLDWEAPTGGYLLQACFATAVAAAKGIDAWLNR